MDNYKLIVRASACSQLMTNDRTGKQMGDTAKGLIKSIAVADVFGLRPQFSSKETEKGHWMEQDAIELLNRLEFQSYQKNMTRVTWEGFTGECDIHAPEQSLIRDIKCAWSASTFSWTTDELEAKAKKAGYDIQGRVYMMLYKCDYFKLDEVLLTTPSDLLKFDDEDFHSVDHIAENKRITTIAFERDAEFEERLFERYQQAEKFYNEYINQLLNK